MLATIGVGIFKAFAEVPRIAIRSLTHVLRRQVPSCCRLPEVG
jgi:hypothetical protein